MSTIKSTSHVAVVGHCNIVSHDKFDVTRDGKYIPRGIGRVELDETNAIHPQNMSRVFARALANESNYFIHRIGLGNGGTVVDVAQNVNFKPPRDGLNPTDRYWEATLYNETYNEIVDDSNINIGVGSGSTPADDPDTIEHVSGPGVRSVEDLTIGSTISSVVITMVLNPSEPSGQVLSQQGDETNIESNFTFDELGLFTAGAPSTSTSGEQLVNVNDKRDVDDTGLLPNQTYTFNIDVDGHGDTEITISTPVVGTGDGINAPVDAITYKDLVDILNTPNGELESAGAFVSITDATPTQLGGKETYGFLKFDSIGRGSSATIRLTDVDLFSNLTGFVSILTAVDGKDAGVRNDPLNPLTERERMLTHLVFSPVTKSADRVLTITYTLSIVVARTVK